MTAAFGHRWTSAHGDDFANTSGRVWALELAGMSRAQILRGLEVARKSSDGWPPVLADFRAACLGVMTLIEVDAMLTRPPRDWSPFASLVKRHIDDHAWRMAGADGQHHQLRKAYDRARAHVLAGGALPEYTPASHQVEHQVEHNPLPPIMYSAHDAIEACRESLGIRDRPEPPAEHQPPVRSAPQPCVRCLGSMKEPDDSRKACGACYGSGVERAYNVKFHDDGTTSGGMP